MYIDNGRNILAASDLRLAQDYFEQIQQTLDSLHHLLLAGLPSASPYTTIKHGNCDFRIWFSSFGVALTPSIIPTTISSFSISRNDPIQPVCSWIYPTARQRIASPISTYISQITEVIPSEGAFSNSSPCPSKPSIFTHTRLQNQDFQGFESKRAKKRAKISSEARMSAQAIYGDTLQVWFWGNVDFILSYLLLN